MNSCIDQEFYPSHVLRDNFGSFSSMFHLFVKEGHISFENLGNFYYTYVLMLKDNMDKVTYDTLINVLWSLITSEDEVLFNPVIPKLFE